MTYIKISKDSWAKYYKNNKQRQKNKKNATERYQSLSKQEEEKKGQYGCEHYKYISENRKQNLAEYRKKYKMRKSALL